MLQRLKENLNKGFFFLSYLCLGLVIVLALISSDPSDNTLFKFNSGSEISKNLLGTFGSYLSDLLLQTFGGASFLIPFILFFWSTRVLVDNKVEWLSKFSLPILLIFSALTLEILNLEGFLTSLNGGILGNGLSQYTIFFLGEFDLKIFLILSLFLSIFFLSLSINLKTTELKKIFLMFFILIRNSFYFFGFILRIRKRLKLASFNINNRPKRSRITVNKEKNLQMPVSNFKASSNYIFPSLDLLEIPNKPPGIEVQNKKDAEINTVLLGNVLNDFKISGEITDVKQGPIVTLFELTPSPGTISQSVIRLADDIARSMSAISTRIFTVSGKDAIGIEIPNKHRETVFLRELLASDSYNLSKCKLPLVLGKDIFGNPVIVDLAKMPHLLVAGTTGSGKSVGINAMLLSLLYCLPPEECRLILIDPKMLELSLYKGIPHLLTEVVTDPKKAISALKWTVKEMQSRYEMMTHLGVREIVDYNAKVKKIIEQGQVIYKEVQVGFDSETGKPVMEKKALDLSLFPKIVVVVDELADLMITSGKEIESAIQRLSQMARAAGIHLIVATQRPSVDVITGTIKSNFPSRISYKVVNKVNSRTILEDQGAEQLLGQGDLLISMLGEKLLRVHGPFVRTEEVQAVVEHLKTQGEPEYLQTVTQEEEESNNFSLDLNEGGDELYNQAVAIVCREKKASTSFIQRHLMIGYNRAARIIEKMESEGIVSPANHVGRREVLVGKDS